MDEIRKRFTQVEQKGINVKACIAELVGSFIFILLGSLVATYTGYYHEQAGLMVDVAIMAGSFGIAYAIAIYLTAHNSGGQINPAVSVGMVASGLTSPLQALGNIVGQVIGAIIATLILRVLTPHSILHGGHLAAPVLPEHSHALRAFFGELIGVFVLQLVILETMWNKESKATNHAPSIIGATLALLLLALGPVSGGSLNPARSIGPAIMCGYVKHLWIFLVAPFCGALLAAPCHLFSITDVSTMLDRAEEAIEQRSVDPLLPSSNAA